MMGNEGEGDFWGIYRGLEKARRRDAHIICTNGGGMVGDVVVEERGCRKCNEVVRLPNGLR
jgi:hypothetical protein